MRKIILLSLAISISLVANEIKSTKDLYNSCKEYIANPKATACSNYINGFRAFHDSTLFHQRYIEAQMRDMGLKSKRKGKKFRVYVDLDNLSNKQIATTIVKYLDDNKNLLENDMRYAIWGSMQELKLLEDKDKNKNRCKKID